MQDIPQIQKPWYRTTGAAIFLGILILLLIGAFIFLALLGYYLWQIRFGDAAGLSQKFNQEFTIDPTKESSSQSNIVSQDINKFIRSYTPILGEQNAPIVILAFIDFECPFCQKSYPIFKKITDKYGSAVKVAFKHLPVPAIHDNALNAHLAAACAHEQNKFWEYYDLLFIHKELSKESLFNYAQQLAINNEQFNDCLNSEKYKFDLEQDLIDASTLGIRGTPTYIINQTKLEGVVTEDFWNKIILKKLKN